MAGGKVGLEGKPTLQYTLLYLLNFIECKYHDFHFFFFNLKEKKKECFIFNLKVYIKRLSSFSFIINKRLF